MKIKSLVLVVMMMFPLVGCETDATVASRNLSKEAEQFNIVRNIVFYNGINGEYMLSLTGRCSIEDDGRQLEVTCKDGKSAYKKHFLGLSDNVTYFAQQVDSAKVSVYRTKGIWKPATILPDVDLYLKEGE